MKIISHFIILLYFRDNNLLRPECTGERTVTVGAGQQHKFGVCWWGKIMNTDNSVNDKVIRIESDTEISVIAVNKVKTVK